MLSQISSSGRYRLRKHLPPCLLPFGDDQNLAYKPGLTIREVKKLQQYEIVW